MTEPNHEVERFAFVRGDAIPDDTGGWVHYSDWEAMKGERDRAKAEKEPDVSVGDVIAAAPDGTIVLDDGITTWNPSRAVAFLVAQAKAQAMAEVREALTGEEAVRAALRVWCQGFEVYAKGTQREAIDRQRLAFQAALSTLDQGVEKRG